MNEQNLILKIKELKQVKPSQDWALLTKRNIMTQRQEMIVPSARFNFGSFALYRIPALSLASIFLFTGIVAAAKTALPGDILFPVRKAAEKIEVGMGDGGEEKDIKMANKRLDDLMKIASENKTVKLEPALKEYSASVADVAKAITREQVKKDPEKLQRVIDSVKDIEERKREISSLGVEIKQKEGEALDSALVELVVSQVAELEGKNLTPYQIELLDDVRVHINSGKYINALDQIFKINQNIKEQNRDNNNQGLEGSNANDKPLEAGEPEIGAGIIFEGEGKGIIIE